MAMKFENKKLNKDDHAKVDRDARVARNVTESMGVFALAVIVVKKVPWKKVNGAISKVIFKV